MPVAYTLAYRLGITPWETAAKDGQQQLDRLFDQASEHHSEHPGKALDLGCGRGQHAIALAQRGWEVTGVDQIGRAVGAARERAQQAGVSVNLVEGDVTALPAATGTGFGFVLDIGCYQGLSPDQRRAYGREVDRVTAPGARLLMLALQPGGRGPLPRGADPQDIMAVLPGWTNEGAEPAETTGLPKPVRARKPTFYWFVKP